MAAPSGRYGNTIGYRVGFALSIGAWVFWLIIAGLILSMSLTARIEGGIAINVLLTVFVLTWFSAATAWLVARWKARGVDDWRQLLWLAYRRRPSDPALAEVWRWDRLGLWLWVTTVGEMILLAVLGLVFGAWR